MIVGTTTAAKILNISTSRLKFLLSSNRVEGAYKTGRMWLISLFNGKPIIYKGKRGPTYPPQSPLQGGLYSLSTPESLLKL